MLNVAFVCEIFLLFHACQNTCHVYANNKHQPKCHESQTQAVDRYGTFSVKTIKIVENYLKFLLTFLNLTELALNEFCGVAVLYIPEEYGEGIFFENKTRQTIKRLGCYKSRSSLDTLLNKSAQSKQKKQNQKQ